MFFFFMPKIPKALVSMVIGGVVIGVVEFFLLAGYPKEVVALVNLFLFLLGVLVILLGVLVIVIGYRHEHGKWPPWLDVIRKIGEDD